MALSPPFDRNARIALRTGFTWLVLLALVHLITPSEPGVAYVFYLWGVVPFGALAAVITVWGLMNAIDLLFEGGLARKYGLAAVALHSISLASFVAYLKYA